MGNSTVSLAFDGELEPITDVGKTSKFQDLGLAGFAST
jgi:hypothetical protein